MNQKWSRNKIINEPKMATASTTAHHKLRSAPPDIIAVLEIRQPGLEMVMQQWMLKIGNAWPLLFTGTRRAYV